MRTLMIAAGIAAATQMVAMAEEAKEADVEVVIEGNDMMKFDKAEFTVTEGQTVSLTFKNVGKVPKEAMGHNLVILNAGEDHMAFSQKCWANMETKLTTGLPKEEEELKKVLAATKVLGPGESETITFTAPAAGEYAYVCTFIGHAALMNGKMKVEAK